MWLRLSISLSELTLCNNSWLEVGNNFSKEGQVILEIVKQGTCELFLDFF